MLHMIYLPNTMALWQAGMTYIRLCSPHGSRMHKRTRYTRIHERYGL